MKFGRVLVSAIGLLCASAVGASSGTLTDDGARAAINQWLAGEGQVQIIGVQEVPAESGARADIVLSGFVWNAPKNDAVTAYVMGPGGGKRVYNGAATAIFIHYTDGRWLLSRVDTPMGSFQNLNIAAP